MVTAYQPYDWQSLQERGDRHRAIYVLLVSHFELLGTRFLKEVPTGGYKRIPYDRIVSKFVTLFRETPPPTILL